MFPRHITKKETIPRFSVQFKNFSTKIQTKAVIKTVSGFHKYILKTLYFWTVY